MADVGLLGLMATGFGLGLRHGIDWDHIAAIADIAGATSDSRGKTAAATTAARPTASGTLAIAGSGMSLVASESWSRFFLATLYALGHALVVVVLGLIAIWTSTILPGWIDPIMERVVGITLLVLGVWIFYQLGRYGRDFQLRSRWMLVFALVGRGWARLKSRIGGVHHHPHPQEIRDYGRGTAFGIGMIHGIGAETGTQALLIAGAAGATTNASGSAMLLAFVVGLVCSNSLIAAFSTFGFVSSQARRTIYLVIGLIAGLFSLALGFTFVTGLGATLPDLQHLLGLD